MSTKTSKVDPSLIVMQVVDLQPGQQGWVVPWSVSVDEEYTAYLDVSSQVSHSSNGTVSMLVKCTEDGYEVEIPAGYRFSHKLPKSSFNEEESKYVKVADIKLAEKVRYPACGSRVERMREELASGVDDPVEQAALDELRRDGL